MSYFLLHVYGKSCVLWDVLMSAASRGCMKFVGGHQFINNDNVFLENFHISVLEFSLNNRCDIYGSPKYFTQDPI